MENTNSETKFFGETSWDNVPAKPRNRTPFVKINYADVMMKFKHGNNPVRFVSAPHQITLHMWKPEHEGIDNSKVFAQGYEIKCAGEDCRLCKDKLKSKPKFLFLVYSRATNDVRIAKLSQNLSTKIKTDLQDDEENWGALSKYDVNIKKNENADPKDYYSVGGIPSSIGKSLTAEEIGKMEKFDKNILHKMVSPSTPEEMERMMNSILKKLSLPGKVITIEDFATLNNIQKEVKTEDADVAQAEDNNSDFPVVN